MMDRRAFIAIVGGSILAAPLGVEAQQVGKLARVGYLSSHSPEAFRVEALRQALHGVGLVEGRNLIIDYRSAEGKFDRLPGRQPSLSV
jgi:putative ABC transport system substrate-binding protein